MAKKRPRKKPTIDPEVADKVLLLLVSGLTERALRAACVDKLEIDARHVDAVITDARRRVTIAATVNRDAVIGEALTRLDDIYRRSIGIQDCKTALQAQREKDKLLGLYQATTLYGDREGSSDEGDDAATARAHLEPLGLAPEGTALSELARLAAARILEHGDDTE